MNKEEALKYLEEKGDSSFIIRTEDEEATFLQNHAKKVEDEIIPGKISDLHKRYDDDILSVTGLKKNPTEKTYDFTKRILSDYKTRAEKVSDYEKEINTLKQQIKDGTADKTVLADLERVKQEYADLQNEKTEEVTKLKSEYEKFRIKAEITSALSGMTFKKNLPESAIKAFTDSVVNNLSDLATFQDGKLVFLKDGVPMRNTHNKLEPYSAKELLEEQLKDIRDMGRKETGPNLGDEITFEKKDGKIIKVAMMIPDSIKYKDELSTYLVKQGLLRGSEEYITAYREYSPGLTAR